MKKIKTNYLNGIIIFIYLLFILTPFKNSIAAISSLSTSQAFGTTIPIEQSQIEIQIQGATIVGDNNLPLPVGTNINYTIKGQTYSSVYHEFIKTGNFVIDNDKGNYKISETITIMTGDNIYFVINSVTLPNEYVIGRSNIMPKDNNYLILSEDILNHIIIKDLTFYGVLSTLSTSTPSVVKTPDNIQISPTATTKEDVFIKDIIMENGVLTALFTDGTSKIINYSNNLPATTKSNVNKDKTTITKIAKEKNATTSINTATSSINIESTSTTTTPAQKSFWGKIKGWFKFK